MTDAKTLIENINQYNQLSVILMVTSIVLMIISVILWHKLNISNSIRVLTGIGSGRAVAKLRADAERDGLHQTENFDKVAPVITWSALSGQITGETKAPSLKLYVPEEKPEIVNTVNYQDSFVIQNIVNKSLASAIFIVEKDVVITALNEQGSGGEL
ncbi:hypothetical protein [Butyrivibrio sp. JL13D10]|uniref:hypothetical protein n=1 Tax=Butyrivibrio sp. JL13D10 TaxID=3236815 RepID=UPI0038B4BB5E